MTIKRILAIICIYLIGVAGWITLGSTSQLRSGQSYYSMDSAVQQLWGGPIIQQAPHMYVKIPGTKRQRSLLPDSNVINVDIDLEQRKKGLIWYPTYKVKFDGTYTLTNADGVQQSVRLYFPFPSKTATYDHFDFIVDGIPQTLDLKTDEGIHYLLELEPMQSRSFNIKYHTRGLREWQYSLSNEIGRVKNLDLNVSSNVSEIDYKYGSLSPMSKITRDGVTQLTWQAEDYFTKQNVALIMPEKLNPGPLSAKMTFFAPVCLLFFFVLITALCVVKKIEIHPMHYLFVTAGFFAFNLLFAYLIDVINIHSAFLLSSITSIFLVVLYLRSALGESFPWLLSALGQVLYLILFSYSFFLKGMTGLTVTLGSILTLGLLMYMTSKINWADYFKKTGKQSIS